MRLIEAWLKCTLTFGGYRPHMSPMSENLLAVAMSGGVDSSVVAAMMSRAGPQGGRIHDAVVESAPAA